MNIKKLTELEKEVEKLQQVKAPSFDWRELFKREIAGEKNQDGSSFVSPEPKWSFDWKKAHQKKIDEIKKDMKQAQIL